jgi:hypothetical protein
VLRQPPNLKKIKCTQAHVLHQKTSTLNDLKVFFLDITFGFKKPRLPLSLCSTDTNGIILFDTFDVIARLYVHLFKEWQKFTHYIWNYHNHTSYLPSSEFHSTNMSFPLCVSHCARLLRVKNKISFFFLRQGLALRSRPASNSWSSSLWLPST